MVAVGAILIAILLPAIQKAGAEGRSAKCVGNLRQIGTLMHSYLADHRMIYPGASSQRIENGVPVGATLFWGQLIAEYAGLKDLRCFICPESRDVHPSLRSGAGGYGFGSVSYAINRYGVAPAISDVYAPIVHTSLPEPSKVLLLLDFDTPGQPYDGWYVTTRSGVNNSWSDQIKRHHGKVNVLFCDGHVESLTEKIRVLGNSASSAPWLEFQYLRRK